MSVAAAGEAEAALPEREGANARRKTPGFKVTSSEFASRKPWCLEGHGQPAVNVNAARQLAKHWDAASAAGTWDCLPAYRCQPGKIACCLRRALSRSTTSIPDPCPNGCRTEPAPRIRGVGIRTPGRAANLLPEPGRRDRAQDAILPSVRHGRHGGKPKIPAMPPTKGRLRISGHSLVTLRWLKGRCNIDRLGNRCRQLDSAAAAGRNP